MSSETNPDTHRPDMEADAVMSTQTLVGTVDQETLVNESQNPDVSSDVDNDPALLTEVTDLIGWIEAEDTEIDVGAETSVVSDIPKGKRSGRRWRDQPTSRTLANLAWEIATHGTGLAAIVHRSAQWIVLIILPSNAWLKPIRDLLPAQHIADIHEAAAPKRGRAAEESDIEQSLRRQRSMFVLCSDLRNAPASIRVGADLTVTIPAPDVDLIRRLLRRTGRGSVPKSLDPAMIAGLDFADFCAIIRPSRRVAETIASLARASNERVAVPAEAMAPDLASTKAFGAAGRWGLQLAQDIRDYRAGTITWSEVDRGAIVYGPPGTGKTLFARSLAQYCKLPLIVSTVSDYFANSPGDLDGVVKAQRDVFTRASMVKPSILFLDEIDAIPNRSTLSNRGRDWWMPIINDFLTLLDSATSTRAGIIVIGATNRIEAIDPALLRPGRLERAIQLPPPDAEGLAGILRHHLGDDLAGIDLLPLARRREGATGAVIMEMVRAAKRRARQAGRPMRLEDLEPTISETDLLSADDLHRISIHEAGHAVVIVHLGGKVKSVMIELDGSLGGKVVGRHYETVLPRRQDLLNEATMILAGRAAEEVVFGVPSLGAGGGSTSDLARATMILTEMHQTQGLGQGLLYIQPVSLSDDLTIDPLFRSRIEQDLGSAYNQALEIVREKQVMIEAVAAALVEARFLTGSDLSLLIARHAGHPPRL